MPVEAPARETLGDVVVGVFASVTKWVVILGGVGLGGLALLASFWMS
jgi:hypothetical protein